jgi:hypothetical protein
MEQDQSIEDRYDHVRLVQPGIPIAREFPTYADGTQRITCQKCRTEFYVRTDVGGVSSWLDRVALCYACGNRNQVYFDNYRR